MAFSDQISASDIEQCPRFSQFTRLDVDEREIRLILLCDNIKVERYPLLKAPPYHAISHFWGPATPTQRICVQGEFVEIRKNVSNLFDVLRERYGDEARFWIDIFCIDQRNLSERNSQVSMMCEIYSRAIGVISWLGQSTPLSQSAFQIIRKRLFCPNNAPVRMCGKSQQIYHFDAVHTDWPSTQQLQTDHDLYRNFADIVVWPALADVIRRPYWGRLWVVQEMIVAAKCTLLCGNDAISLEDLVLVGHRWIVKCQQYQGSKKHSGLEAVRASSYRDVINTWVPIEKIAVEYRKQYKEDKILLMELVDSFTGKECSNIRDKVFALRSLSKEAATIKVDYSKTVLEVFLSLVQSGLLMSDSGRGFQSLPFFIRHMGIDHDNLNEQLAGLPRTVVNLKSRLNGTIVTAIKPEHGPETDELEQSVGVYIRVVAKGRDQQVEYYRSSQSQRADQFLEDAQPGDVLCTIQLASPLLLLLRPQRDTKIDITYQAINNLHDWSFEWDPAVQLPSGDRIIGEVFVSKTAEFDRSPIQTFSIESHSLQGLTLWKENVDLWYTIE